MGGGSIGADIQYLGNLLMAFLFFLIGIPVYLWARRDVQKAVPPKDAKAVPGKESGYFTGYELLGTAVICVVALFAILAFSTGYIKI